MPVIKTATSIFENAPWKQVYKVDAKGEFTSDLPPKMAAVLGYAHVEASTLKACEYAVSKAHEEYTATQTTTCKVILYQVQSRAYVVRNDKVVLNESGLSFCDGLGVAVSASVFTEHTIKSAGKTLYRYEKVADHSLPGSMFGSGSIGLAHARDTRANGRLDWTPELEEVFRRIGIGLENVALQLKDLQNPKNLLAVAESLAKLLPETT